MHGKIIVIVGPTAVGKTNLSIKLAQKFNAEIVNADSLQIYRYMDIGTAKITNSEMQGIPHHLLNIKNPDESYTVAEFQRDSRREIKYIMCRGNVPIIVGGSGLYTESLIYDVSHGGEVEPNHQLRAELEEIANNQGNDYLWEKLNQRDPKAAEKIHPNNVRRVVRALEICQETGRLFSDWQNERKNRPLYYDPLIIGLDTDRELLYERINQRAAIMLNNGLLDELEEAIHQFGPEAEALKGIGYKELIPYLSGEYSLEKSLADIQKNSRHFAKRQLTWFRNRLPQTHWFNLVEYPQQLENINQMVTDFLKE